MTDQIDRALLKDINHYYDIITYDYAYRITIFMNIYLPVWRYENLVGIWWSKTRIRGDIWQTAAPSIEYIRTGGGGRGGLLNLHYSVSQEGYEASRNGSNRA